MRRILTDGCCEIFADYCRMLVWVGNYLNYTDGWPVVIDGNDIGTTSAGSILSVPSGIALAMAMSMCYFTCC
jgi:hypothetical protein